MAEAPVSPRPSRGAFALLGVFALGIVFGAALVVLVGHLHELRHPLGHRARGDGLPRHVDRVIRDFGLDPEQERQVRAILGRSRDDIHKTLDGAHAEIRALLRPDQQKKLDRMHLPHERGADDAHGREN